jgi:predicted MFS family arabinose efflux permease
MLKRLRKLYTKFPSLFWIVVGTRFIDAFGSTLLFPFFALYITQRFGVGMTQAGVLLGMSSLFGLIGIMAGGALADKFGRRQLILFGLIFSAISNLSLGLANDISLLYPLIIIVGLLSHVAGPAYEAMLVDILPEETRQEGYAILRVVFNFAWIFGTALGGLIASRSFFALFVIDSIISCIVAALIFRLLPETSPLGKEKKRENDESLWQTILGYRVVMKDLAFIAFTITGMLALIVYQQQYSSLAVYMRDVHDIDSQGFGAILSITGLEVVIFQFWVSRAIRHRPAFLIMAFSTLVFAIGFLMYGLVSSFILFTIAAVTICFGEMFFFPTSSVIAANFAPEDMRGRYMAVSGLVWSIPATIGPAAAGIIIDNYNPNLVWYIGGFICIISGMGYYGLHLKVGKQQRFAPPPIE